MNDGRKTVPDAFYVQVVGARMFATKLTGQQARILTGKKLDPNGVSIGDTSVVLFIHHNPLSMGREGGSWALISPDRQSAIRLLEPK